MTGFRSRFVWPAAVGIIAAVATLASAESISLFLGGRGNPLNAVGSLLIDLAPPGVKDLMIELFGTADKVALFVILGAVVLAFAAMAGVVQHRAAPWGAAILAAVALIAVVAVQTRADSMVTDLIPTLGGAVVGVVVLRALDARLHAWERAQNLSRTRATVAQPAPITLPESADSPGRSPGTLERRRFFVLAGSVGIGGAIAGIAARSASAATSAVRAARRGIRLPGATSAAEPLAADATLAEPGITPFITPNADFYRIDTALQIPSIDPADWRLRITGMVEEEIEVGYDELLALPLEEHLVTLACVSNEVGGDLIGNALWLGYPIRELLARARPIAGADMVLSASIDGFTASTPLEVLTDPGTAAILAVGMNGEPLPLEHGFPVRMVVPGLFGYVSATKWLVSLEVTRFADAQGYWTPRGWSERGPVKLSSRIDTPRAAVPAGQVVIAGVAWAQHTGISAVEVRVDDGPWQPAELAATATVDSWLQWRLPWQAIAGQHVVTVRATDAAGRVQTADEAPPAPDGSTGLHSVSIAVT